MSPDPKGGRHNKESNKGITVFKIIFKDGISSDLQSEFQSPQIKKKVNMVIPILMQQ